MREKGLAMSSIVDLRTPNAANKDHARATPITRRRGACRRCQARKVRCDGKTACSQCQRLGFECRYPRSTRQRRTSVKETGAPTPVSLEQLQDFGDRNFMPDLTEPTTPQNISPFLFGDEIDTNRPPGQGDDLQDDITTASAETERPERTSDYPTDSLDYSFISSQRAFFPEFDLIDEHFDFGTCSHFPHVTDKSDSSKASSLQRRPSGIVDVFPLGGRDSRFGDPICAEKIHQNDLIKGALLRDIQEHCKRQHSPQREEIARAFGKLINEESINIYPPLTTLRREAMFRLDKGFALDCIDEQMKACLKDPQGVSTFLDRSSLVHLVPEMVEQTPFPPPERALSHIILALGSHILLAQGRHDKIGHLGYDPRAQFSEALKLRTQILERNFSVRNLQALAVMFYFAVLTGADETPGLLSSSIQYTQMMRLGRGSAVDNLCETMADRQRTKRAFWFLYSMEKEFCPKVFTDITDGNNTACNSTGFLAAKGWDPVSGLGTPIFPKLVDLFLGL
ncbi:hypothetical protein PENCOP_c001G03915 [Penicillium coprophilum]|uniref:Zn(2)-C6 fungal-type domain-containing protein n=1 Tax=Penicillium coprophilum TaxID=36646 RepID=A0A1V6V5H8_9EURO|nr:hypothetical protein PENCOP_c001G03915 [Penicillium coprophilum]